MLISEILHKKIEESLSKVSEQLEIPVENPIKFVIEKPKNIDFGDFATSLPLQLSKLFKMKPLEIANLLKNHLEDIDQVSDCTILAPGFINFSLSTDWIQDQLLNILNLGNNYGHMVKDSNSKKIQVEFVSVNPTGKLHLGHIRGAVIGSTLSNVLESQNNIVTREYYVNDAGNQMHNFGKSLIERIKEINLQNFEITEDLYKGEDIIEIAKELSKNYTNSNFDQLSGEITIKGMQICINNIKKDLERLNIIHDEWFYESSLLSTKYFDETLDKLAKSDLTYTKDDALWIKTQSLGDERDNVLIKSSDSKPTYFATDIAYHRDKFERRKFDKVINLWGADHHGHIKRMEIVLEKLNIDSSKLKIILNQIVSLKNSEGVFKFSKRAGTSIYMKDLIDEIGSDACRFSFLNRSPDSQMEIDIDLLKKESSENPVFYVQYAHARLCSIEKTCLNKDIDIDNANLELLNSEPEIKLIKKLIDYPELLSKIETTLNVHELSIFSIELSQTIQQFYENCRVIDDENNLNLTKSRLLLVKASKITLSNILGLMGMSAPEKM
jgi:arginyl-tRNA synthetase